MSREQKIAEAKRLWDGGLTASRIASRIGVSKSTIYRWCNPDFAERQRRVSVAWKDRHREQNRARDNAYSREHRGTCSECSGPMGIGVKADGVCADCLGKERDRKARKVVALWAEGKTFPEIQAAMGWSKGSLSRSLFEFRAEGYDLPYRYTTGKRAALRHRRAA